VCVPHPVPIRAWLASLELFGIKLGLDTMRRLAEALESPERTFASVHVAGTNGKGSVAAFTDQALRAAGHGIGRYTSPHLVHLEERVHVRGAPIASEQLDAALERVRRAVGALQQTGSLEAPPTYFEVTTAAAFDVFRDARVDAAVVEVGLGGRFDATNIVAPIAAAITSIALDHERHLGSTLRQIAYEKAGIVKPGVPVVIGRLPRDAREVVERVCHEQSAPLIDALDGCIVETGRVAGRTQLALKTPSRRYGPLMLALRGDHQVDNAVVAVRLLETLDARGLTIGAEAVTRGLTDAVWPARLDLRTLPDGRAILVDGAHNPAGASALAAYVAAEWPSGLPLVFGAMRDKDLTRMIAALEPVARPLVLTRAPGRRAAEVDSLAAAATQAGVDDVEVEPLVERALERAWQHGRTIAVAGSLYLAGDVLARLT
jgi:dihydrofolate synthase/folylpolyglutamate synthase